MSILKRFWQRSSASARRVHSDEEGAALVEFVIIFPMQLMLTLVIIQYALLIHAHMVVTQAAQRGARAAAVSDLADGVNLQTSAVRSVARTVAAITPVDAAGSYSQIGNVPNPGAAGKLQWEGSGGIRTDREQEAYALLRKVNVRRQTSGPDHGLVSCEVHFDYVMVIPVGGRTISILNQAAGAATADRGDRPTFTVKRAGFFMAPWLMGPQ